MFWQIYLVHYLPNIVSLYRLEGWLDFGMGKPSLNHLYKCLPSLHMLTISPLFFLQKQLLLLVDLQSQVISLGFSDIEHNWPVNINICEMLHLLQIYKYYQQLWSEIGVIRPSNKSKSRAMKAALTRLALRELAPIDGGYLLLDQEFLQTPQPW